MNEINFLNVFFTVFSFILLIIPGFVLARTKILGKGADSVLSSAVLYCFQPALMFVSFQKTSFNPEIAVNMLIVAGLSAVIHFAMIGFLSLVFRNKSNDAKINCLKFASVFSNCGFIGIPFLKSLFDGTPYQGEALIYGAIVIAVFNVITWTVGIYMMTGDKSQISVRKGLLNPTVICTALGIALFLILKTPVVELAEQGSNLDSFLTKVMGVCNYLAESVTPISMIVVGIRLSEISFKKLFVDGMAYVSALNKLVIMSIISIVVVAFLPVSETIKYVLFFLHSMPSASSTVLFAVNFGGDSDSATVFVLLSTILSVASLPLMFLLFKFSIGL